MKVKYLGKTTDDQVQWGGNDDPRKFLLINAVYEVKNKYVHTWHTKLELHMYPGKYFNSVNFKEV